MKIKTLDEFAAICESYSGSIEYDCCCADIPNYEWDRRMAKRKKTFPYKKLVDMIKVQCPDMYDKLMLTLRNPYDKQTYETEDYLVLTHSATEYFFKKTKKAQ